MHITYDHEADALYICFREAEVVTAHLAEGIAADCDAEGRLAGIEILDASQRVGNVDILRHAAFENLGVGSVRSR